MPSTITTSSIPDLTIVHPLVLLSVVDHYKRSAATPSKRVVGLLLGQWIGETVHVTNSYAVPFEEDEKDPTVWFIDHNYHEHMCILFKKISAKERPVGWYHTGPKLRPSDLTINELFRKYAPPNPVLIIINPEPKELGLPTEAYCAVEEIHDDGTATTRTFVHINSVIEAEEAEEIGVEHMLRDVKEGVTVGTLTAQIDTKIASLKTLKSQLANIHRYLGRVASGDLPINHQIVYSLQDMFNLLPDVHAAESVRAMTVNTNDQLMMIYVGSIIRAVITLHDLINNKIEDHQRNQLVSAPTVPLLRKEQPPAVSVDGAAAAEMMQE